MPISAISAAVLAPQPALAQSFSKLIVFGDSLSDNGNASRFGVVAPAVFNNGRFSNGPVWAEQLGFSPLGGYGIVTGSADYAVAGTLTGAQVTHPGMQTQIINYLQGGGIFTGSTLTTVWGGVNDIIAGVNLANNAANSQAIVSQYATDAANNIGSVLEVIASSGGGTVLILNQPNPSLTPYFKGAAGGSLAGAGAAVLNTALAAHIETERAAHPQTKFVVLDVAALYSAVVKNPTAFGFENATDSCFGAGNPCDNPGRYFFGDGLHPTAAGHILIAQFAKETLDGLSNYGTTGIATAAEAETVLRRRTHAIANAQSHLHGAYFERASPKLSFSGSENLARQNARNGGAMPSVSDQIMSLTAFLDFSPSQNWKWGGQLGFSSSDSKAGTLNYADKGASADMYIGWRSSRGWFWNAFAGAGYDSLSVKRGPAAGLVNTARTTGWSGSGKFQTGIYLPLRNWTVSPRAAVAYIKNSVQPYSESGLLPRMSVSRREITAPSAEASLRFETPAKSVYAELGCQKYLSFDMSPVEVALVNSLAPSVTTVVASPPTDRMTFSTGFHRQLSAGFSLNVDYRGEFGRGYGAHTVALSLNLNR